MPLALSFVTDCNIPTGAKYEDVELGGISALAYSGQGNRWLALSDSRRLYELDIDLESRPIEVVPRRLVRLGWPGRPYFDPEGLVVYIVEPMERPPGFENPAIHRGITELVALAPDYLLALERSYIEEGKKGAYRIEIFSVSLDGATDVSEIDSLEADSDWIPVAKTLLIDLDTIVPRLTPPYHSLENFEGMALGPALAGGGRSLLVASDNNFFEHQRTAFLLFRLTGKPGGP